MCEKSQSHQEGRISRRKGNISTWKEAPQDHHQLLLYFILHNITRKMSLYHDTPSPSTDQEDIMTVWRDEKGLYATGAGSCRCHNLNQTGPPLTQTQTQRHNARAPQPHHSRIARVYRCCIPARGTSSSRRAPSAVWRSCSPAPRCSSACISASRTSVMDSRRATLPRPPPSAGSDEAMMPTSPATAVSPGLHSSLGRC